MKTKIFALAILIFSFNISYSQIIKETNRTIEVTGSAELEIEPDEIVFEIKYGEYWKEEFEKGKEYNEYVTKIPLEEIEKSLLTELTSIGISKEQLILTDATSSTYWVAEAKGFRKSKSIIINLSDFKKVNEIINKVKTKGVNGMEIIELKNKKIAEYRKQVKIEAIKAAKEKASYLLQSIGEDIGKITSVVELDNNSGYFYKPLNLFSNTIMNSSPNNDSGIENIKKIKLKYEIRTTFEIK